jgi:hypothetical protein
MMSFDINILTDTTLDEIATAISELSFRRNRGQLCWPELGPERKVLKDLFQRRAALIRGSKIVDVYDLGAMLILDAMVAQHQHDLRLAAQAKPPFDKPRETVT